MSTLADTKKQMLRQLNTSIEPWPLRFAQWLPKPYRFASGEDMCWFEIEEDRWCFLSAMGSRTLITSVSRFPTPLADAVAPPFEVSEELLGRFEIYIEYVDGPSADLIVAYADRFLQIADEARDYNAVHLAAAWYRRAFR